MALFNDAMFQQETYGGIPAWLSDILRMAEANPAPSQGFQQQPNEAQLPANAQPTQGAMPQQQQPQFGMPTFNPMEATNTSPAAMPMYPMGGGQGAMPTGSEPTQELTARANQQQQPQFMGPGGSLQSSLYQIAGALNPSLRHLAHDAQTQQSTAMAARYLASNGLNPALAQLVATNPAALGSYLTNQLGTKAPIEVSPGATLVDPATRKPFYTAPLKEEARSELQKRADAAGLIPGSQEYKDFMLRGGKNADAPLSATDKKALFSAEDEIPQTSSTIDALNRALELNDQTFSGFGASTLGTIGNKVPGGSMFVDPKKARATQEWEKIMGPEALQAMANTLKGATTDFELRKFIEMLGDPATDPAVRKSIIQRLKTMAERKLEIQKARVNDLRGGTYFKPGYSGTGGGSAAATPQNYVWDGTKLVPQ